MYPLMHGSPASQASYRINTPKPRAAPVLMQETVVNLASFKDTKPAIPTRPFLTKFRVYFAEDLDIDRATLSAYCECVVAAGGVIMTQFNPRSSDILICRYRSGSEYIMVNIQLFKTMPGNVMLMAAFELGIKSGMYHRNAALASQGAYPRDY